MSEKEPKNLAVSIRARLLNIAKQSNRDFNAILLHFFQERFLYRLSKSPYRNNFILKGALMFIVYNIPLSRPTKDIDFLGSLISNDESEIQKIIKDVVSISVNDGVSFYPDSVDTEKITEDADYHGVRVYFNGKLAKIKKRIQLDIGFGDQVIPEPQNVEFPTFLDLPIPKIKVYSNESAIAEKFESIVRFNYLTSRMKDFYDIWYIANHYSFNYKHFRKAIITTFRVRNTLIDDRSLVFNIKFKSNAEKEEQWQAFLSRNRIIVDSNFKELVDFIENFLNPVFTNETKISIWNPSILKWE